MIKVAVLWLINEDGELLLAQRALNKIPDPGVWGPSVTGKLEPGEEFDEALAREVEEELSLKPTLYAPRSLLKMEYLHPDGEWRWFGIYFAPFTKEKTKLIKIDSVEVAGIQWSSPKDIEAKMKQAPETFPASARTVWPAVFRALRDLQAL
jgi:isopentenyldiphosphate isomerase